MYNRTLALSLSLPLIAALGGCASSMIDVRPGSDQVAAATPAQVGQCRPLGKTTVSVLAKVGFVDRSIEAVDANLLQLARNSAVDMGGDTVVPGERPEVGRRVFEIYKCRP
jgi:hypothetical protein